MTGTKTSRRRRSRPRAETWRNSDILFLLTCYDVWSATPPRGCRCGDPLPATA